MILDKNANVALNNIATYFSWPSMMQYFQTHIVEFIIATIMIIFYKKIRRMMQSGAKKLLTKTTNNNPGLTTFIRSMSTFVIDLFLGLVILKLIGINLTGIATVIVSMSLLIGFAFKDILANFFGGIILLTFKPFIVGDIVEYKGFVGKIYKIEIFYTSLIDFQREEVIVPNANIINNELKNLSSTAHRRLTLTIGVGYESDIELVKDTIYQLIYAKKDDLFYIEDEAPVIGLGEIAASSLNFDIKVLVRENKYLDAKFYLNENIKTKFDELDIALPYNILDVNLNSHTNN